MCEHACIHLGHNTVVIASELVIFESALVRVLISILIIPPSQCALTVIPCLSGRDAAPSLHVCNRGRDAH